MSRSAGPVSDTLPVENRPLDRSLLAVLSEADLDAADDEGLGGNGEYQDLQACDVEDLWEAVAVQTLALQNVMSAPDRVAAEETYKAERPMDDERAALWHLDLGVASACVGLVVLGAHPVLSCNGGEFGTAHAFSSPVIRLYLEDADPRKLVDLANRAGIRLTTWDGRIVMNALTTRSFTRFADLVLAASDMMPSPVGSAAGT